MARPTCARCLQPLSHCVCAHVPRLASRTRVLVLQHPEESRHPLNTGRLAVLGLVNAELVVGERFEPACWSDDETEPWLLFPGPNAVTPAEVAARASRPVRLLVPDATWRHARSLLHRNPALAALPRIALPEGPPSAYRVRRAREPAAVATIEAITRTLNALEAPARFDALLAPFEALVEGQLAAQRVEPPAAGI